MMLRLHPFPCKLFADKSIHSPHHPLQGYQPIIRKNSENRMQYKEILFSFIAEVHPVSQELKNPASLKNPFGLSHEVTHQFIFLFFPENALQTVGMVVGLEWGRWELAHNLEQYNQSTKHVVPKHYQGFLWFLFLLWAYGLMEVMT